MTGAKRSDAAKEHEYSYQAPYNAVEPTTQAVPPGPMTALRTSGLRPLRQAGPPPPDVGGHACRPKSTGHNRDSS